MIVRRPGVTRLASEYLPRSAFFDHPPSVTSSLIFAASEWHHPCELSHTDTFVERARKVMWLLPRSAVLAQRSEASGRKGAAGCLHGQSQDWPSPPRPRTTQRPARISDINRRTRAVQKCCAIDSGIFFEIIRLASEDKTSTRLVRLWNRRYKTPGLSIVC